MTNVRLLPGLPGSPTLPRSARAPVLIALMLMVPASIALAQTNSDAANKGTVERCSGPEHHEFDFWLGEWEVRSADGDFLGHNEIRRVAGGCGLLESWRGVSGVEGMSINAYDGDRGTWTQRWVGAGATLWLAGGLEGSQMVLAGTAPRTTPGGAVLDRITWTPLPDGRVRQVWEVSTNEGESWQTLFVGFYSAAGERRPTAPGAAR